MIAAELKIRPHIMVADLLPYEPKLMLMVTYLESNYISYNSTHAQNVSKERVVKGGSNGDSDTSIDSRDEILGANGCEVAIKQ
jgi:hypothetical protein